MLGFQNRTFYSDDTEHLQYQGEWNLTAFYHTSSDVGDMETFSSTFDQDASIGFTLPIPATAFYYYGFPQCCGASFSVCIDCDTKDPIFIFVNGSSTNQEDDHFDKTDLQVLYSKVFDAPGIHHITIKNVVANGISRLTLAKIELQALIRESVNDEIAAATSSPPSTGNPLSAGVLTGVAFAAAALFLGAIVLAACIRVRRKYRIPFIQSDTKSLGGIVIPPSPEPFHPPSYIQSTVAPTPPASSQPNESAQGHERTRRIVKNRPQSTVVTPYITIPTYLPQAYIQAHRALGPHRPQTGSSGFSAIPSIESDGGPVLLDRNGNALPVNSIDFGQWVYIPPGPVSGPFRKREIRTTY